MLNSMVTKTRWRIQHKQYGTQELLQCLKRTEKNKLKNIM